MVDIEKRFAFANLLEVIPIGKTKKVYDLKFGSSEDLIKAA